MTQQPLLADQRFAMLQGAWRAAGEVLDDRGALRGDLAEATAKFMRRKCCIGLPKDECQTAFQSALEIAQASIRFRRSNCGHLPPETVRRYQLLHTLATSLKSSFPDVEEALIRAACSELEWRWDR